MIHLVWYRYGNSKTYKEFNSYKTMSQYIRRRNIKEHYIFNDNELVILLDNNYWPVSKLKEKIKKQLDRVDETFNRTMNILIM